MWGIFYCTHPNVSVVSSNGVPDVQGFLKSKCLGLLELSIIVKVCAVEGCSLSGVSL